MPSRAADLFAKLDRDGLAAIDELIQDRAAEQQFLDFKGARDDPGNSLCESDSNTLAKAISGFANADGGVIVWGVDCRKANKDQPKKTPLRDASEFRKKIEESLSRLTLPVHIGTESIEILDQTNAEPDRRAGYVVTLVPPSKITPIRSRIKDNETYYVRVGESFVPASHSALLWMFGRRPKGVHWIQLANIPVAFQPGQDFAYIGFRLGLANGGSTFLEKPYVSAQPGNLFTSRILRVSTSGTGNVSHSFTGNWQVCKLNDDVVVPGGCLDICTIAILISPSATVEQDVEFELTFGALDAEPRRVVISCPRATLELALRRIGAGESVDSNEVFAIDEIIEGAKALATD